MATTTTYPNALAPAARADAPRRRNLFLRILRALEDSRRRKAEIEVRRIRALMGDADLGFKDALLPFQGE